MQLTASQIYLGYALSKLNKYQDAIECYNKAISINPNYDVIWYHKGNVLNNLNQHYEAIECYDKAISINPNYDVAWNNKGNYLLNSIIRPCINQIKQILRSY
ncbi:unnamed protein product (macronuclear) [Paramecium tetraurelia]|uniref:Uncharacterized protein n=1 Tax=Paramecium tetraurelia TaxID=5888 RepID=A0E6V6_PARTE|nr:uncharacterized protein GSPATT00023751001 [Paramecium tetraurelia]CAK91023.1 unnamed protein product [Paramecium tetraurelia]|eukprot:XP_001458420.1 hypothetical protein (macronuclear) [Paramecium tetraurelia strain d4-2]